MSYFQHTKRDVENARAAGVVEARAELADAFAALAADTAAKLDLEDYDRGYVIEDLIGRMVELSRGMGGDPSLFESLRSFLRHTYAYPLIEAPAAAKPVKTHRFEAAHSPGSCTAMVLDANGFGDVCGLGPEADVHQPAKVLDLSQAIREAWEIETFDGIPRHEHVGMPDDKCYRSFDGRRCDRYYGNVVHETVYEERSDR